MSLRSQQDEGGANGGGRYRAETDVARIRRSAARSPFPYRARVRPIGRWLKMEERERGRSLGWICRLRFRRSRCAALRDGGRFR
ncbi:MAG: hypothetical protein AAFY15_14640 [Cyanobacteria bacterium J06648_11]